MSAQRGWIGVDLDGTLAEYHGWVRPTHIGAPVPAMLARVRQWLAEGKDVRIMTARCYPFPLVLPEHQGCAITEHLGDGFMTLSPTHANPLPVAISLERGQEAVSAILAIRNWCETHFGRVLPITCVKDFAMVEMYDDRCKQVQPNTGVLIEDIAAQAVTR